MSFSNGFIALIAITIYYVNEGFKGALINSFCQKHIPSKIRATTLSSINVYINIVSAILALTAGYIFDIMSIRLGLMVAFVYTLTVFIFSYAFRPDITKNRSLPAQAGL